MDKDDFNQVMKLAWSLWQQLSSVRDMKRPGLEGTATFEVCFDKARVLYQEFKGRYVG